MKLKKVGIEVYRNRKSKATIHLHDAGLLSFSKSAAEMMGIKEGDKISLHHDEDNKKDWYILVGDDGLNLRKDKERFACNSASLVDIIFKSIDQYEKSITLPIGSEPTEIEGEKYWAIITAAKA